MFINKNNKENNFINIDCKQMGGVNNVVLI